MLYPPCGSQLLRDERVRFAAYQHPHPLENDILLKIQAAPEAGVTPLQVLHDNVEELIKEVNLMSETFAVSAWFCFPHNQRKSPCSRLPLFVQHQLQIMKQHKEQTIGQ